MIQLLYRETLANIKVLTWRKKSEKCQRKTLKKEETNQDVEW